MHMNELAVMQFTLSFLDDIEQVDTKSGNDKC